MDDKKHSKKKPSEKNVKGKEKGTEMSDRNKAGKRETTGLEPPTRNKNARQIINKLRRGVNNNQPKDSSRTKKSKDQAKGGEQRQGPRSKTDKRDSTKRMKNRQRDSPTKKQEKNTSENKDLSESYVFEDVNKTEALKIPDTSWTGTKSGKFSGQEETEDLKEVDKYYSLVPKNPDPGEGIYAYANITWDENKGSLVYRVVEPDLSEEDEKLLQKIKDIIQDRLDVNFEEIGKIKAKSYLFEKLQESLEILGEELDYVQEESIRYYLERDLIDMGKIEPFMRDPNIEEISCDGVDIPIYVYHRNAEYGSLETNKAFEDEGHLDTYVRRLGQIVGKTVSMADPLVDASLPDGSRLQATLGTDIARKGSNFTIRKFTENPLTPVDLIEFGTLDPRVLSYLWTAIEHQNSVLISGGTATGKTTMLNVISLFIKPEMKIVTIEDTAELRLPHNHWVPEVAREAMAEKGSDEIDMFKLLKESLRQRPDYIVVGEVRGAEAFVLFQQMSTGHPGLATIHAENPERLISRLTTKPIDLPPSLMSALDIVIFLRKVRRNGTLQRKIDQVVEIKRFSREENVPKMNRVFKWDPSEDRLKNTNPSLILNEISEVQGKTEEELQEELRDREEVMKWMVHESIRDLDSIGEALAKYYSNKEPIMERIRSG